MSMSDQINREFTQVGNQILARSRDELYLHMRYLDLALSALSFQITTDIEGIGTNGEILAAHPAVLADLFEENRLKVNRVYLHCVMHCLLHHITKRPPRDERLWHISCDMACEALIDTLRVRSVRMGVSRFRQNWYTLLQKSHSVLTAEIIFHELEKMKLSPDQITALEAGFCIDTHILWPSAAPDLPDTASNMSGLRLKWKEINDKTRAHAEMIRGTEAGEGDDLIRELKAENRKRYDYRSMLRRFAVWKEEMRVDPDGFDYIFYTYGLSLYGNMPLIEPPEYREMKKTEEFAIVLDVSMSTDGDLIRSFLEQTWSVLSERESFFRDVHVHIIQCDDAVQQDTVITSLSELHDCSQNLVLHGGGGTDFRPAFAYVEKLVEQKIFSNLRGLLYFTDGKGIYPARKPAWETAFVFLEEDYTDTQVPPWAVKLIIPKEDLQKQSSADPLRLDYEFVW